MKTLYTLLSILALAIAATAQIWDILDKAPLFRDALVPERYTLFHDDYNLFNMNMSISRLRSRNITVHNTWSILPDAFTSHAELDANLLCHKPNERGTIFFQHRDLFIKGSPMRFFIQTPWTVSYAKKIQRKLRKANFVVTKDVVKTCRFVVVEKVTTTAVHRGRIEYRPRWILETESSVHQYEPGSREHIAKAKKILETTYPTSEVILILIFGLLPVWLILGWGFWIGSRRIKRKADENRVYEDDNNEADRDRETKDIGDVEMDDGEGTVLSRDNVTVHVADLGVRVDRSEQSQVFF
jgi:hypothetical protein